MRALGGMTKAGREYSSFRFMIVGSLAKKVTLSGTKHGEVVGLHQLKSANPHIYSDKVL